MAHDGRLARDDEGWPHKPFRCSLRGREKHFLPELPPLVPFGEPSEVTNAEVEYARRVVEGAEETEGEVTEDGGPQRKQGSYS
jgi:hypothetical protein